MVKYQLFPQNRLSYGDERSASEIKKKWGRKLR